MADERCDFCSAPVVAAHYLAPDHVIEEVPGVQRISTGGWAACADCDRLLQAGDTEGVIDHSVDRLRRTNRSWAAVPRAEARSVVATTQTRFFVLMDIGEVERREVPR